MADEGDEPAALHTRPSPFIALSQSHHELYHRPKVAHGKRVVESGDAAHKYKENSARLFLLLGEQLVVPALCTVWRVFLTEKSKRPRKLVINHTVHENLQGLGDDEAGSALSECAKVCATN